MKTTTKNNTGIKVTAGVKAGSVLPSNHNRSGLRVKSSVKASSSYHLNHNRLLARA